VGRIGFWQLLLDDKVSSWEASAINSAHDAADKAQLASLELSAQVGALQGRVAGLSREVIMLRAALTVLANTLKDTGVLDERLLDARLEAAVEEALAPPEPAARPIEAAPAATAVRRTVCLRCRNSVPASSTSMTADGPVCDRCPPTASRAG
jgi:hypothetical protein